MARLIYPGDRFVTEVVIDGEARSMVFRCKATYKAGKEYWVESEEGFSVPMAACQKAYPVQRPKPKGGALDVYEQEALIDDKEADRETGRCVHEERGGRV